MALVWGIGWARHGGVGVTDLLPTELLEMQTMLAALGEQWQRQGREEGLQAGYAYLLIRLQVCRFGSLPEVTQQRIALATPKQLEHGAEQVLGASSLEAIFGLMTQ